MRHMSTEGGPGGILSDGGEILPQVRVKRRINSPRTGGAPTKNNTTQLGGKGNKKSPIPDRLAQSLHFVPANLEIPKKQTRFYDRQHGSNITPDLEEKWRNDSNDKH